MNCNINPKTLNRSLKSYTWYSIFNRAYFWSSLFILYFSTAVSLKQIFQLEAIYYASVFLLEVPSGYFSDFLGRKITLFISALSFIVSYCLFFIGGSFAVFAFAQFFLAIGFSFASGTDTSLHYALLSALKKESEYGEREANLSSWGLISVAASAVIGGLFAWFSEYRVAYALSLLISIVSFILVLNMKDPDTHNPQREIPEKPIQQLKLVFKKLKDPALNYLFVFTVLITVLNHIPYELYQIYIHNILDSLPNVYIRNASPLILGFHTALSMIIAAIFAKRSIKIEKHLGTKLTLIIMIFILSLMIAIMGISGSYIIVMLLMLRGLPNAVSSPIVRAGTTHKLSTSLRATYYSTKSLLGRLSFSLVLFLFSQLPGDGFNGSLIVGTALGIISLIILLVLPIDKKTRS